jgi:hypothetical protein
MSSLPQLNKKYLIIALFALLVLIVGVFFAYRTIINPNQNGQITQTPVIEDLTANLPQLTSDITSRTLLADTMLAWFDTTLNTEGLYATDLTCSQDTEATTSSCSVYNDDYVSGLSIIWARWKLHNQFLGEDLVAYANKMQQDISSASAGGTLAANNFPICNLMRDIYSDENLDKDVRASAFDICMMSQTIEPDSSINKDDYQFSNAAVDDWAIYLSENALQGNSDLVLENLADFSSVLENTRSQRGLTAKNQCYLALLTENLPQSATHSATINDFIGTYQNNYFTTEKINPLEKDALAACTIASSHGNFNREWLHEQIYNLHQNQAAEFGLGIIPLPFLSGITDGAQPWLVNTWLNGLLIGGLVDY